LAVRIISHYFRLVFPAYGLIGGKCGGAVSECLLVAFEGHILKDGGVLFTRVHAAVGL